MTAPLGIVGAGAIGSTLARLAVAAGVDVVLCNSRGPETLTALVDELGPCVRAATLQEVAEHAEVIVLAIPLLAVAGLDAAPLAGKVVVDATNYYPQRDGQLPELDTDALTASELVQQQLPDATVIKTFNSITFASLGNGARPAGAADRSALPVAGDDPTAKARVVALLDTLGYDAVDTGALANSWRFEPGTPAYCDPYMPAWPTEKLPVTELVAWLLAAPVVTQTPEDIAALLAKAVRGPAGGAFPDVA